MERKVELGILLTLAWVGVVNSFSMSGLEYRIDTGPIKSAIFRSPPFTLEPGDVQDKYYYGIPFPKGHIALKGFDAEVVDEDGNSVPLSEVYLHHWIVENYYKSGEKLTENDKSFVWAGNSGVCKGTLRQLFGLGSETRHTSTFIPGPYGIEVGNFEVIPEGYEEEWILNVHAIDTRGTVDPSGCLECRCDLYNVTTDSYGRPLRQGYVGGLYCCYDGTHCQLNMGFNREKRTFYLQYTVRYIEWNENIVPVKVYILDVTDTGKHCKVEYDIPVCATSSNLDDCVHTLEANINIPLGGNIVYAVSHQHAGGMGSTLYGEDGREICASLPLYGTGTEPGNEAGYIVGMSTCYPEPGTVKVYSGERVRLQSKYSRMKGHTGVMGLFYIAVDTRQPTSYFQASQESLNWIEAHSDFWSKVLFIVPSVAVGVAIGCGIAYFARKRDRGDYEHLSS